MGVVSENKKKLVIIGGGFAGLFAANKLGKRKDLEITLIDKRNFHLFQPLLYQVATGGLSPGDIAAPIRAVLKNRKSVKVLQAKVVDLNAESRTVSLEDGDELSYDYLLVASGVTHDYFGNEQWEEHSPGLKTIEDSLEMRRKILSSFELAENETDEDLRKALLTFVIVGGGPTGVELAGAIGELASNTLKGEFRSISLDRVRTILLEGSDRLLNSFPEKLSAKAKKQLESLKVEVRLNSFVTAVDENGVKFSEKGEEQSISSKTVLWAAGVKASELGGIISRNTGASLEPNGRVKVLADLSVESFPEIMVAGDLASVVDAAGKKVPGLAPAAMQQGSYVAKRLAAILDDREIKPFKYRDKGALAVIGRNAAVADIGPFRFSGFLAWAIWAFVHVYFLIDFGNKLVVATQWVWNYLTKKRGARLITSAFKTRIERKEVV